MVTELPYQASPKAIADQDQGAGQQPGARRHPRPQRPVVGQDDTKLVIELKRDANANVVLNNLYKHTPLQTSFGVNMVALVDGVPRTLNLVQALQAYVDHQVDVITPAVRVPAAQGRRPGPTSSRACSRRST